VTYDVYVDGSWSPQLKRGGWGVVTIAADGTRAELSGTLYDTTSQGAEIRAAIEALARLPSGLSCIRLHSDSSALVNGVNTLLATWRNRDWQTVSGHKLAHHDLWAELDGRLRERGETVTVTWIAGQGHNAHHARAHALAVTAMRNPVAPPATQPIEIIIGDGDPASKLESLPFLAIGVREGTTDGEVRMKTSQGVAVDRSVVEAYAAALIAAYEAECLGPALTTRRGSVRVTINPAMGTVDLARDGQDPLTETEAVQAALMLLAGAHAVLEIGANGQNNTIR
jgi:ribonuclease HI